MDEGLDFPCSRSGVIIIKVSIGRTWSMHWSILLLHNHDDTVLDCEHCVGASSGKSISIWLPSVFPRRLLVDPTSCNHNWPSHSHSTKWEHGASPTKTFESSRDPECPATRSPPARTAMESHSPSI